MTLLEYPVVTRTSAQRWRDRRSCLVRDDLFDPQRHEVFEIPEALAKAFVVRHHYSSAYPAAVVRVGLHECLDDGSRILVGVAVFGIPVQRKVLELFCDLEPYRESLELSRFVLLDHVPANAESWFLARAFSLVLQRGVRGVVSFADPMPRHTAHGGIVMPGHVGTIYQATNATYTGRATARTLTLLPDGTVLNDRAAQKIRRQERGARYVHDRLVLLGAAPWKAGTPHAQWLSGALSDIGARRVRHLGNHRFAFSLGHNSRQRRAVHLRFAPRAYPKTLDL